MGHSISSSCSRIIIWSSSRSSKIGAVTLAFRALVLSLWVPGQVGHSITSICSCRIMISSREAAALVRAVRSTMAAAVAAVVPLWQAYGFRNHYVEVWDSLTDAPVCAHVCPAVFVSISLLFCLQSQRCYVPFPEWAWLDRLLAPKSGELPMPLEPQQMLEPAKKML